MTPDQSHVAGLELALAELAEYSPTAHALGEYHLRPLIHKAKSAPAEVAQGEAVEVVCITQGGCNVTWTATKELTPAGTALMSVNQHDRIVAAMATQPDAELVELRKNAARYQWLLASDWYVGPDNFYCGEGGDMQNYENDNFCSVNLNEAIDAKLASLRN
jgi:hypothetical protein